MVSVISWLFLLYFIILFAERAQSLVHIFLSPETKVFGSAFDSYVNTLAFISLLATIVLLVGFNKGFWLSLVSASQTVDYSILTITAGVILVSGMVHTEFTVPPIQFVAYGMLIVAMALMTVCNIKEAGAAFAHWYSFLYLTLFSMAIPVVYHSNMERAAIFHVAEAFVSLLLVLVFTVLLRRLFLGEGKDLLLWLPILLAVVGDVLVLALRWKEEVNSFVLIFLIASAVSFALGKILFAVVK